jgi:thioredoxin reductase (NADPH)
MEKVNHYDAVVIGAGLAGLTAGIYLSRARLKTLIVTTELWQRLPPLLIHTK